eukprot:TRINITY_DN81720_c0_g1_i1.p1 TRINITY_DN81720_c0_g1~~TRINITY_DN81720_c0_g1_i1.p1  ORF type:complete len:311 (+),score=58.02 TRINITY_DN81720_c0_g1_i1:98-934(+)
MSADDLCMQNVLAASVEENEAIEKDRAGDAPGAIAKYEESERLLAAAIAAALPNHAEDHPKLVQHRQELLDRISHLKSLKGGAPTIPLEQQIKAVQLGMQAHSAASRAASSAGGVKQMAAVAAIGAVGGAIVLGPLGLTLVGAAGGAAVAGVAATRSDTIGDVTRGVGSFAAMGVEKAIDANRQHDITGKVVAAGGKAVTAARAVDGKLGVTDKVGRGVCAAMSTAQDIEQKHNVSGKVASGVGFGLTALSKGLDKVTSAASSSTKPAATKPAGTGGY